MSTNKTASTSHGMSRRTILLISASWGTHPSRSSLMRSEMFLSLTWQNHWLYKWSDGPKDPNTHCAPFRILLSMRYFNHFHHEFKYADRREQKRSLSYRSDMVPFIPRSRSPAKSVFTFKSGYGKCPAWRSGGISTTYSLDDWLILQNTMKSRSLELSNQQDTNHCPLTIPSWNLLCEVSLFLGRILHCPRQYKQHRSHIIRIT